LVLLRENTETPRDEEWDETLRLLTLSPAELDRIKVLVVTDGGGPTPEQRKRLSRATGGKPLHAAVVSESVKVRFIVSSVALFMSKVQSFRVDEIDAAFNHLGLSVQERRVATENIAEMTKLVALKR
jgi:hypothetical protein